MKEQKKKPTQDVIYLVLLIITVLLGYWGFNEYHLMNDSNPNFSDLIYDTIRLFPLEHDFNGEALPWSLNIARFSAPLLVVWFFVKLFYSRIQRWADIIRIRYLYKNHLIICGLGAKSKTLLDNDLLLQKKKGHSSLKRNIVLIEQNPDNYYLNEMRSAGIRVIVGDATDHLYLLKAGIVSAEKVKISTGNDQNNLRISQSIKEIFDIPEYYKARGNKPVILEVDIIDNDNELAFKQLEDKEGDMIEIRTFNFYRKFAAYLVDKFSPDQSRIIHQSKMPAHVIIFGINKLSECILLEIAHLYHFASDRKTIITLVEIDIESKRERLIVNHPGIDDVVDLRLIDENAFFKKLDFANNSLPDLCFVCFDSDSRNFLTAKRVRQFFLNKKLITDKDSFLAEVVDPGLLKTPTVVFISTSLSNIFTLYGNFTEIIKTLFLNNESLYGNEQFASYLNETEDLYEAIACQIHNLYLRLDKKELDTEWDKLTDEGKDQNRWAARYIAIKLRYLGAKMVNLENSGELFNLADINQEQQETICRMEHNRWNAEKILTGYVPGEYLPDHIFYTMLKNNLKWHKDIRPWDELMQSEKRKDEELNDLKRLFEHIKNTKIVYS